MKSRTQFLINKKKVSNFTWFEPFAIYRMNSGIGNILQLIHIYFEVLKVHPNGCLLQCEVHYRNGGGTCSGIDIFQPICRKSLKLTNAVFFLVCISLQFGKNKQFDLITVIMKKKDRHILGKRCTKNIQHLLLFKGLLDYN